VAALAAGLVFFVYAGSIASIDREATIRLEYEIEKQRFELRRQGYGYEPNREVSRLEDRIRSLEENQAQLKADTSPVVKSAADQRFTQQLVTTTTTRIGSIIILLFLVQILVTLYRYNVRAAAFYDGRADALLLIQGKDAELGRLVDLFTPTSVDFGRMPSTPLHAVLDVAKGALKHTPTS
jgi:hypothetical protein